MEPKKYILHQHLEQSFNGRYIVYRKQCLCRTIHLNLITFVDGKTAAFLQGREFLAFGSLLNVIPEEDLYYVNFGDPSVFKYFANQYVALSNRKVIF